MTRLLIYLFAKGDPSQPSVRAKTGKLSGAVGIICNILLCAMKLVVGTVSGSVSITADALNNLSDATSALVTLVGFRLAERPADDDHPYGHARYEYLSGLAVAALIVVIGFELAKSSLNKILHPAAVEMSIPMLAVLIGSVLVKLWLCLFNRRLGKRIASQTLLAASADSRNDVVATSAVLIAVLAEHFFSWQIDGWMGMAVALFILYSGISLGKETISPLLGETASPELQRLIVDVIQTEPKILGYHDLMVHDYGPGQRFASIHVEMDERESALECHELIDQLERKCLQEHNVHLVIHYDPVVTDDPELERMRAVVGKILTAIDSRITFHDFRMVQGKDNTNLIFDIALPAELMQQQKTIKKHLDEQLRSQGDCTYHTVVTFDMATIHHEVRRSDCGPET